MPDRVTIKKFAELQGYSQCAIRIKISRGVWKEGEQWYRAPDGRIHISQAGVDAWIASGYEHLRSPGSPKAIARL